MVTGEKNAVDSNNKPALQEQQLQVEDQKNKIDLLTQFIQSNFPNF